MLELRFIIPCKMQGNSYKMWFVFFNWQDKKLARNWNAPKVNSRPGTLSITFKMSSAGNIEWMFSYPINNPENTAVRKMSNGFTHHRFVEQQPKKSRKNRWRAVLLVIFTVESRCECVFSSFSSYDVTGPVLEIHLNMPPWKALTRQRTRPADVS